MKVICDEKTISFKFDDLDRAHWATGRNHRFLQDVKMLIPAGEREFDPETNWWTINIKHHELFGMIKDRHYRSTVEQGNLFASAA